jgi:uncharacterized protein
MTVPARYYLWAPALFVVLVLMACRIEDRFIYHPSKDIVQTPREVGLPFEDLYFSTSDGVRLNGWFIPHAGARATVVWFHGNAGNIGHRVDNIKLLHDKIRVNIFIFDYRGYGRSAGLASEEGLYRDSVAALMLVQNRLGVDAKNLILFGQSLGAAVATEMARRFRCQGLILEAPFTSIGDMAKTILPFLPIGLLLQTKFEVVEKIATINVPLLVLHGDRDDVVPFAQGRKVFSAAPAPKEFYTIAGATHNDTYRVGGDAYFERLRVFIEGVLGP